MSTSPQSVPLGEPPLREWQVSRSSSRYDRLVAAPSNHDLTIMWTGWATIGFVLVIFVILVFLGILTSATARKNPFNVYLLFLMVPDIEFGILCSITCALNSSAGEYWSPWMCKFQSYYTVWTVASSAWLNGAIARQLHAMLSSSFVRRHYKPPEVNDVIKQSLIVFSYAAVLSSFGVIEPFWLPFKTFPVSGQGCIPLEYSWQSSIFYFLVFMPLLAGIPLIYVCWVCYDIWKRHLMPPTGRRRLLFVYFIRIIGAFVVMWVPFLVLVFMAGGWPWAVWAGGTWRYGPVEAEREREKKRRENHSR